MWIFSPLAQKLRPPWRENLQTPDSVVSIIYISCCIRYTLCIFSDMDDSYCDCAFSAFRWRKAHGALGWDYFAASLTILRPAAPTYCLLLFFFFPFFLFLVFCSFFFFFASSSFSLPLTLSLSVHLSPSLFFFFFFIFFLFFLGAHTCTFSLSSTFIYHNIPSFFFLGCSLFIYFSLPP